jgi:glycolate oxidase FAD binding subunit
MPRATAPATALVAALGASADADRGACESWAIAGVVPALVARPSDAAEVAATVAAAAAAGAALVPLGRGAHRGLGHPPARYDLALVTERLARIRDYTPADMTLTVEAGTTVAALDAVLAREGQWLPLEPPVPDVTTVGGLLAADLAGPLAASQGRARDFVIGVEVVTAAGVRARAGGRVVKNVAGYDLMKLFTGSLGTLAVLTEVTFKVRPRPEIQRVLLFAVPDLTSALAVAGAVTASEGVLAVVASADADGARVLVRLGGVAADVAAAATRVLPVTEAASVELERDGADTDPAVAAALARVRDFAQHVAGDVVVRCAVLPSRLPAVASAIAAAVPDVVAWRVDALRGTLHAALVTARATAALATLAGIADRHGAHLVVERWPVELAGSVAVWHPLPAALPLMRRMKQALDPTGVFAPGRFVGGL